MPSGLLICYFTSHTPTPTFQQISTIHTLYMSLHNGGRNCQRLNENSACKLSRGTIVIATSHQGISSYTESHVYSKNCKELLLRDLHEMKDNVDWPPNVLENIPILDHTLVFLYYGKHKISKLLISCDFDQKCNINQPMFDIVICTDW